MMAESNTVPLLTFVGDDNTVNSENATDVQHIQESDVTPHIDDSKEPFLYSRMDRAHLSFSSIFRYAREGNLSAIQFALGNSDAKMIQKRVNSKDEEQLTALHYAARYNRIECCKFLVESGANVNIEGDEKITPLHMAARYRRKKSRRGSKSDIELTNTSPNNRNSNLPSGASLSLVQCEESNPTIDNSVILYLASRSADINKQDFYGCTPLHYASIRGNEIATEHLLLCDNIRVDEMDNERMTPLHLACSHGQTEIASLLIQYGANIRAKEESNSTPLHLACAEGNTMIIEMIFDKAQEQHKWQIIREMLDDVDNESNTPLHIAVLNNCLAAARLCIEKGADVDAVNVNMETPLHLAAHVGNLELCKMMIEKNSRVDAFDTDRRTPLHRAVHQNKVDCVNYFLEKGTNVELRDCNSFTPLLLAADEGCKATLELLLEYGADVNVFEREERSAVYLAAQNNNVDVLEQLLNNVTCQELRLLNCPNHKSYTPVHIAAKKGYDKVVGLLIAHNADLFAKNESEKTAMHLAAKNGRTRVVKMLLEQDSTLCTGVDEDSNSPLHLAALAGHTQVVHELLKGGANIVARNSIAWTPLDCAASKGNVGVAKVLLENSSPVDPMDKSKVTPLYLACKSGHLDMAKLLLEWDADVSVSVVTDEKTDPQNGCNCLDAAIDNQHEEVAKMLINSSNWEAAMRNSTINPHTKTRDTPMRKLIRKMPDVATLVFKRCVVMSEDHPQNEKFNITFNCEFLDDVFSQWSAKKQHIHEGHASDAVSEGGWCASLSNCYDDNGNVLTSAMPYETSSTILKTNHPLMLMVKNGRKNLLDHPLVQNLLLHKWASFGRFCYYANLLIYSIFLFFLNFYMISTTPTFVYYDQAKYNISQRSWSECEDVWKILPNLKQRLGTLISMYVVLVLAILDMCKELFQLCNAGTKYFSFENFIEWIIYLLSFVSVINLDECQRVTGVRYWWQWNTGSLAILMAWLNLVLFIRKFPRFGIYVVMFVDVLQTFVKFFVVFILFILAFAITFFLLLQNQPSFQTVQLSVIKTTVMMIGEFDYDNVFNARLSSSANESQVFYSKISYIIFVVFLITMSIIIMNLLVGLAVDNISAVQDQAALTRLAMQVELVLNVEALLPLSLRRRFTLQRIIVKPNMKTNAITTFFSNKQHNIVSDLNPKLEDFERITTLQSTLSNQMNVITQSVKTLRAQNVRMESMLSTIMAHLQIRLEDTDENMEDN